MAQLGYLGILGISWDSLRLQLSHCDPPQPRDRRGGRHIFAKSRCCGLAKPEATATLHTTHRPGAQSDVFWRSKNRRYRWYTDIPSKYFKILQNTSKYFKILQNTSKSNIIQHFHTFSDTPKWSKDVKGRLAPRFLMAQVWIASLAGWFSWCDLPVGSMRPESHQSGPSEWIAKAKTKEAARRASTSQISQQNFSMYFDHFVRAFPAVSWIYGVEVGAWFAANQIRKTYLARVKGCFKKLLDPDSGRVHRVTFQTAGRETSWDLPSLFFVVPVFFVPSGELTFCHGKSPCY